MAFSVNAQTKGTITGSVKDKNSREIFSDVVLERLAKNENSLHLEVGQHPGMLGQHVPESTFDCFASSYDLVNRTGWKGENILEPSEPYNKQYRHKPWVTVAFLAF